MPSTSDICAKVRNLSADNPQRHEIFFQALHDLAENIRLLRRDRPNRRAKPVDDLAAPFAEILCRYAVHDRRPKEARQTLSGHPADTALEVFDLLKEASWAGEQFQWLVGSSILGHFKTLLATTGHPAARGFYADIMQRTVDRACEASGERLTQALDILENTPSSTAERALGLTALAGEKTRLLYGRLLAPYESEGAPLLFTPAPFSAIERYTGDLLTRLRQGESLEDAASPDTNLSLSAALLGAHLLSKAPESYFEKPLFPAEGNRPASPSAALLCDKTVRAPLMAALNTDGISQRVCCWLYDAVSTASASRRNRVREIASQFTDPLCRSALDEALSTPLPPGA
jgi:hypothetical protein